MADQNQSTDRPDMVSMVYAIGKAIGALKEAEALAVRRYGHSKRIELALADARLLADGCMRRVLREPYDFKA